MCRIDDIASCSASRRTGSAICRIPARQPNLRSRLVCANAALTSRSPLTTNGTYFAFAVPVSASSMVGAVADHWKVPPGAGLNVAVVSERAFRAPERPL